MDKKRVYTFGNGQAEGKADMKNLLGGKGANLAEMNLIGIPVPPGFTITTDVCTEYNTLGRDKVVELLKDEVVKAITHVETLMKSKFGDVENPLLVSVRSGARASMPGMMDTILNLGLNDEVVEGIIRKTGNARFAWDSYRRFVQMYGDVVLGMKPTNKDDIDPFEAIIEEVKKAKGVELEKIAGTLGLDQKKTKDLIDEMRNEWEEQKRGVTITELDGAYQMCTRPEIYEYLIKIAKQPKRRVLTDVLLETLSIIAYKQPVTKMEIEKIRGVSSDHAVNKLVEYHLVCELGRLDAPGRPLLFGTTEEFLRSFGVHSIDDLPVLSPVQVEEFKQEAEEEMHVKLDV